MLVDGERQDVGKMFFGGGLAYWVGATPGVAATARDHVRRVADRDGRFVPQTDPVIVGAL